MADRKRVVAVAFLVLVLIIPMPQIMVASLKFPRFTLSPRTEKQIEKFLKDHASDLANLFPSTGSYSDRSQTRNGEAPSGNNGGGNNPDQTPATHAAGSYVYSFQVGTPPQSVAGVLHLGSDLVWTQCDCTDSVCGTPLLLQGQGATTFEPLQSSTMTQQPCTGSVCRNFLLGQQQTCDDDDTTNDPRCFYTYMYSGGGQANTTGYLATDVLTFGSSDPVSLTFGCGFFNVGDFGGASGVIGLGRGTLSLVSQLQAGGWFSYYFAPDGGSSSSGSSVTTESFILFGPDATPKTASFLSTSLLENSVYPSLYYVGLTGIQVDGQDLNIPSGTFDLQTTDGSGGVITSLTVPVTFLDQRAYGVLKDELTRKIGLQTADGSALLGLDLCYRSQSLLTSGKIPAMALVFDGNAVMKLETSNYFYMDAATGLECLSIMGSTAGGGSLLGNLIQEGTHMIYDTASNRLQFESFQQQASPAPSSEGSPPPLAPPLRILSLLWIVLPIYYMLYWSTAF